MDPSPALDLVCIGNAIVDVLMPGTAATLAAWELLPGAMTLIDAARAERLTAAMTATDGGRIRRASGGSAANTAVVAAGLGVSAAFLGTVADDPLGRAFRDDLRRAGVAFPERAAAAGRGPGGATGRCLVVVTGDGQRTMSTFLGAAAEFGPEDLDPALIRGAGITYLEGYLFDPPPAQAAFREAARLAREGGGRVAISLSDAFCVHRHRDAFAAFIAADADIVFANETELLALHPGGFEAALATLAASCAIAVVTRGAAGSVALRGAERVEIEAAPAEVVDTTGAGDAYAAGFLAGLARGADLAACGRLASREAARIIAHFGARPPG